MKKHILFLLLCAILPLFSMAITMDDFFALNPEKIKELPIKDILLIITLLVPIAKIIVRLTKTDKDDKALIVILETLKEFTPFFTKKLK